MEKEADHEQIEDYPDISFEELLAQEKKDSFWYVWKFLKIYQVRPKR